MKITLYNTTSENNRLNKKLTKILDIENTKVMNTSNLLNLQIFIKRDLVSDFNKINYLYIDSYKRYYFVDVTIENGFLVLNCSIDVLMTYKSAILNLTATVTRNENLKNGYLEDKNYNIMAYENIVCKTFPNGLTNDSIILMTVG